MQFRFWGAVCSTDGPDAFLMACAAVRLAATPPVTVPLYRSQPTVRTDGPRDCRSALCSPSGSQPFPLSASRGTYPPLPLAGDADEVSLCAVPSARGSDRFCNVSAVPPADAGVLEELWGGCYVVGTLTTLLLFRLCAPLDCRALFTKGFSVPLRQSIAAIGATASTPP